MALVLLCGYPCSGKTTFSNRLAARLRSHDYGVTVVSADGRLNASEYAESTESTPPGEIYKDSGAEKRARSEARAAVERSLDGKRVVVLDAANYVKGYRYELWCVARTTNSSYCVVHMDTHSATCISRDRDRNVYGEKLMGELIARFEAPNDRNRWDKPLFVVSTREEEHDGERRADDNDNSNSDDDLASEIDKVVDCIRGKTSKLTASRATALNVRPNSDIFATFDRLTRAAEATLIASIRGGELAPGAQLSLSVAGCARKISVRRVPRVSELRSMRRALLNLTRLHPPQGDVCDADILGGYVDYVNEQLNI